MKEEELEDFKNDGMCGDLLCKRLCRGKATSRASVILGYFMFVVLENFGLKGGWVVKKKMMLVL